MSASTDDVTFEDARRTSAGRLVVGVIASVLITIVGAVAVDLTNRVPSTEGAGPANGGANAPAPGGTDAPGGTGAPGAAAKAAVTIVEFTFDPTPLTVKAGSTVAITNKDQAKHTFTSGARDAPDGRFDLKLDGGATVSTASLAAGSYPYFCIIHPGMKGTVEVTE